MLPNDYAGYYNKLYIFQDKLLDIIFSFDNMFYLTGGTALTRFHNYHHRYSDDLDFFTNKSNCFKSEFREFIELTKATGISYDITVESKDFIRVLFKEEDKEEVKEKEEDKEEDKEEEEDKLSMNTLLLQVDFVNDYVQRIEKPDVISGYRIDTANEIISNKFGAVLNRDEPKDIADILEAYGQGYKNWGKALEMALLKQNFAVEELIVRLETFPVKLLEKIKYVDGSIKDTHLMSCRDILSSIIEEFTT